MTLNAWTVEKELAIIENSLKVSFWKMGFFSTYKISRPRRGKGSGYTRGKCKSKFWSLFMTVLMEAAILVTTNER